MDIETRVLLLGIFKKHEDETLNEVVLKLEQSHLFSYKEGKKQLKTLKNLGFISHEALTFQGEQEAKLIEKEFKLP